MQIRSRDLIPPKTRAKSLSRNGNSFQKEGFNWTWREHVLMTTTKELCLAIVKYLFILEVNGFLAYSCRFMSINFVSSQSVQRVVFFEFRFICNRKNSHF